MLWNFRKKINRRFLNLNALVDENRSSRQTTTEWLSLQQQTLTQNTIGKHDRDERVWAYQAQERPFRQTQRTIQFDLIDRKCRSIYPCFFDYFLFLVYLNQIELHRRSMRRQCRRRLCAAASWTLSSPLADRLHPNSIRLFCESFFQKKTLQKVNLPERVRWWRLQFR